MRVLFLTCHLPFPPTSGGRRREFELLRRLDGCDVELCVVSEACDADAANVGRLSDVCRTVRVFPADHPHDANGALPASMRRYWSPVAATYVAQRLRAAAFDVVHVEGFYMAQLLPGSCPVPRLLVEQNVEFSLWEQRAAIASDEHRATLLAVGERVRRAELRSWLDSDLVAAVTDDDRRTIRMAAPGVPVRVVPDGADHITSGGSRRPVGPAGGPGGGSGRLVFVGNFRYDPNVDAARFLCQEIMPRVWAVAPDVVVQLVGIAPPREVLALAERHRGVTVTGPVADVAPYLGAADVVVCPLRIGGGVKVKILEALAAGKAVVTTSIGAQGLPANGRACWVEDRAEDFARAVLTLLTDPRRRRQQEHRAALAAAALPTWDGAAHALLACYRELLSQSNTEPGRAVIGA